MKTFFIIFLLVAMVFASPVEKESKIVGGENAIEHEAPFMVTLQVDRPGTGDFRHTCGGSILNPTWILTAAHCVTLNGLDLDYEIIAGQHNLAVESGREQRRRVVQIEVHESFVSGPDVGPWDVCVLRLESSLNFIEGIVGPINLPAPGAYHIGDVQLFGWGSTSTTNTAIIPDILQTVTKDIIPLDICREIVNAVMEHEPLHYTNVCTGPLNSIVTAWRPDCATRWERRSEFAEDIVVNNSNDFVFQLEIVGIASWISSFPCGAINAVSVYVRVSSFIDWINQRVN